MGVDARARIIYGFAFAGEGCTSEFDEAMYDAYTKDPEKWMAEYQGLSEPEDYESNQDARLAHWKAKDELPLDVEWEGDLTGGVTTDYLCIREATIRGDWDEPTEIPLDHIKQMPEWDAMLKAFCEKAGVEFQTPKWYLIASMG